MKYLNQFLIIAFFTLSVPLQSYAQYIEGKTYLCQQPIDSIIIDGKANEQSWTTANWTTDFIDIEGEENEAPHFKTQVKMLWDEEFFYFYAKLEEPHIWAKLKERDTVVYWDNDFELFIDPNGDTHNYYELELNALNTVWDLMLTKPYRDGGKAITSWDIKGLKTAVYIDGTINNTSDIDNYWSVEVAIPWKALLETIPKRNRTISGKEMRINYSRVQWQTEMVDATYVKKTKDGKRLREYNWVWSPQRAIAMHEPEFWGRVRFSSNQVGAKEKINFDSTSEKVRQTLYTIHRAQRHRLRKLGSFSANKEELLNSTNVVLNQTINWELKAAQYWYHATLADPFDNNLIWHIDETGRLWSTTIK